MPTYEYRCPEGHDFERFLKMSEATDTLTCPVHGKTATRIISGGAGLVFKGSGFYITDYGKDGKKDQKSAATGGGKAENSRASDSKDSSSSGDSKSSGDSGSSGEKSVESKKSGDGKGAESKSGDAKPAEAKPAASTGSGKSGSGTTE
jgi:putative FmdB family regulatory protein